jgi:hypothetical protein
VTERLAAPPYGTGTLADILPSAAALLGVPGFTDRLGLIGSSGQGEAVGAVTVLLVDGLGWWPWLDRLEHAPALAAMERRVLTTTVPSTTPTALASLGTGLPPGSHGIVGASFLLPEYDRVLHPLSWVDDPHPVATQPEATVFERVAAAGVPVMSVGATAYAGSGLTRAALRGSAYAGSDGPDAMIEALAARGRGLAYAYVPELDRLGHVHGVASPEWAEGLAAVDRLVERLVDGLGPRDRLIVTADHGMVDCPPTARVRVEDLPDYAEVTTVAGEPRLRHVYCRSGAVQDLVLAWRESLGDRAWVAGRDEFIASGLLGATEQDYAERVGDVVVMARGDTTLASDCDPLVSSLLGQHGSVTEAEMAIPLLQAGGSHG